MGNKKVHRRALIHADALHYFVKKLMFPLEHTAVAHSSGDSV